MKFRPPLQYCFIFLTLLFSIGCQYNPHANLLTTTEPREENIVGTYILDRYYLPGNRTLPNTDIRVELRPDGTFTAINVPPWNFGEPDENFLSAFKSGEGNWEKSVIGRLDPGSRKIWGVYLRTRDDQFHPANITGDKPPYGLIFTLGDPDSGHAILLKKE